MPAEANDAGPESPGARPGRRFALLLAALGPAVAVGAALLVRGGLSVGRLDADEREYWALATNLLQGSLGEHPARRTIGFPLLLAALRAVVGDDYLRAQLLLSALVGLSPILLYRLVRRELGSERAARLASLGMLLWPAFVRFGATLYSDSAALEVFLLFLVALPAPRAVGARRPPWWRWALSGSLLGLCMHMRPMYLLYAPIAAALAFQRAGPGARLRSAALLAAGALGVVAPWSVYLSRREGRAVLLSSNAGETMAGGLNPRLLEMEREALRTPEQRATWVGPGKWLPPRLNGYLSAEEQRLPYTESSRLMSGRAVEWVRSHPGEAAYLTARKLAYMWGFHPLWNGASQSLLGNLLLLPLLAAAAAALARLRRALPSLAVFWTLPLFSSLVACVSWGSWRFRMPGDVGVLALAAALAAIPEVTRFLPPGARVEPPAGRGGPGGSPRPVAPRPPFLP